MFICNLSFKKTISRPVVNFFPKPRLDKVGGVWYCIGAT